MNTYYILACGPSIKDQDITYLRDKHCITISNFFVHPEFENLNITYHLFPNLHHPITTPMGIAWFQEGEKKFKDGQKIMVHIGQKDMIEDNNLFEKQQVLYWDRGGTCPSTLPHQVDDYVSMSQVALQVGIYEAQRDNIKNIIIMGIDHSWINHIYESKHFYKEEENVMNKMGYTEWFGTSTPEEALRMEKNNLVGLSNLYEKYRNIALSLGIEIFNGTPNSTITTLPVKNFNDE